MAAGTILIEPALGQFSNKKSLQAFKPTLNVENDTKYKGDLDKIDAETVRNTITQTMRDVENVGRPVFGTLAKPNTHAYVQVIGPEGRTIKCFNNIGIPGTDSHNYYGYYTADRKQREEGGMFDDVMETLTSFANVFRKEKESTRGLVPALDDNGNQVYGSLKNVWTDWILQSVQESRVEKTQVVETFGDSYFYAYGQKPRSITFSGLLMNTRDYNWRSIFWQNWDEYFRATKLVERSARVYIQWDEIIVEGYPINAVCSEVADSPNAMKFSFTLFVTRYVNIAAQSGFLTQQYMRIAQLRAGSGLGMISKKQGFRLLGGEDDTSTAFNSERFGMFGFEGVAGLRTGEGAQFERFSLLGQLGPQLGNSLQRLALQSEAVRDAQQTAIGRSLLRNLGYLTSAAQKAIKFSSSNPRFNDRQRGIFATSLWQRVQLDLMTSLATDATNIAEDAMNVRRGEINQLIVAAQEYMDLTKDNTVQGQKFQLSPYAKYNSVARLMTMISPGDWGGDYTGIRNRTGGVVLLDEGGTPIQEVIANYAIAERAVVERRENLSVGERESVEDLLDV